jgi:hypothetical protein
MKITASGTASGTAIQYALRPVRVSKLALKDSSKEVCNFFMECKALSSCMF